MIELFQAKIHVIAEQSPLGWGSRVEQAPGTGADPNCRGHASAAHGGSGKSSKDIELQQQCLRTSLNNGAGEHETPLPVRFEASKRV